MMYVRVCCTRLLTYTTVNTVQYSHLLEGYKEKIPFVKPAPIDEAKEKKPKA